MGTYPVKGHINNSKLGASQHNSGSEKLGTESKTEVSQNSDTIGL